MEKLEYKELKNKVPYSFKLNKSKVNQWKDGSYPVCLVVRKDDLRKIIFLGYSALPDQWDNDTQRYKMDKRRKDLHPDREENNTWLNKKATDCERILKDFDERRIDWTLNQFEEAVMNKSKKTGVEAYFNKHIEKLKLSGHIGNARCYEQCLHILKEHNPKFDKLVFSEIDKRYVDKVHDYLYNERGVAINTIRYYIKALRALLNKAIKDGEASPVTYPFGKDGYTIQSEPTDKRYLPSEIIETLKTASLEDFHLNLYRNIFLFSYYCQGMAFVDMANLTKSNIVKEEGASYIKYRRQKTEGKGSEYIYVAISKQIQTLLDWFKGNNVLIGDYLLPVVTIDGYEGEKFYQHIRDRLHRYNKNLKVLAIELKIEGIKLTGYVSRHSYAMKLKNSDISEDVISEALGHKDLKTTKTYLGGFAKKTISKANEVL